MIFAALAFLADENIHPAVIEYLRSEGLNVLSVRECGLSGRDDESILACAASKYLTVLTHDGDFGKLAIAERKPFHGIVFLRPGGRLALAAISPCGRQESKPAPCANAVAIRLGVTTFAIDDEFRQ